MDINTANSNTILEIEKKFLIEMPDLNKLVQQYHATAHSIEQTYLVTEDGTERRVRRTLSPYGDGEHIYRHYYTEKRAADETGFKRVETENTIYYLDYYKYLREADPELHPIVKTRYTFYIGKQLYELDVYEFSKEYATLEIELASEDTEFKWPELLVKVADVTEDKRFKNKALAKALAFPTIE